MGLWNWAARITHADNHARYRVAFSHLDAVPRPVDEAITAALRRGRQITRSEALRVPTVQRGRNLICSIASLPLVQYGPDRRTTPTPLLSQIDPNVANVVTIAQTLEDLLFDSISWWRVLERGPFGFPTKAAHVARTSVSLQPPADGRSRAPLPSDEDPRNAVVYLDGKEVSVRDVIRFDSPNPAVLKVGGTAIRRALKLLETSSLYAEDPRARDYFTPTEGAEEMDDDEIREFLGTWRSSRRNRSTAFVPEGVEYHATEDPTPADLQLAELEKGAGLGIANAMGIDPEDLGISTTSRSYQNAVDRRRDRINDVLALFMRAITDRLTMPDVTPEGYYVQFNLDDYMKSNPTERWGVYKIAIEQGVLTETEVRVMENIPGDAPKPEAAPAPTPPAAGDNVRPIRTNASFGALLHSFAVSIADPLSVDMTRRTISGLAMPWKQVSTRHDGLRYRFQPNSLVWSETSRVKHFKDHTQAVGKALQLVNGADGLHSTMSVSAGPVGDELLHLANDGVYDGLSVGVDIDFSAPGHVVLAADGVYDVYRATLVEVTTTPIPSFDNARVTNVAASRTGSETTMDKCATCHTEHAPNVACQPKETASPTFSVDQMTQLMNSFMAGKAKDDVHKPADVAQTPPNGPALVDATKAGAAKIEVTEPAPYRFDRKGNLRKGSHDFSTDIYAGKMNGDLAAMDRANTFVKETFERKEFDVATTDVNELNPVTNRPDMYVDQRQFLYPVWDSFSKGTLADITPFTFPKFNSSAGLMGNHTEGVEPTSGTFTVTNQTVTPSAVSGKAKITRETWDQGGNPQVSGLIWRQMERAWWEALEAFAVATLDATTPTAITLTTAAVDAALVNELTSKLALLQFVRGGFSMGNAPTQVDLFKALEAAKDTTGRKLLPAIGPMNSVGTIRPRAAGIDVNGVAFLPAWALAATGIVPASSYLYDTEVVHGWATTPQRIDITVTEVANVYIGLWGYKAAAVSDITGIREIIYDPA